MHPPSSAHRWTPLSTDRCPTTITINGFGNEIEVLKSKEKPKKLSVLGNDGRIYAFLCKKEIKGDMRKNSRMMEFNTVVNRLLKESGDSRSRHLTLRTFSVLPMTEECGLIEWVPNTTGFRHLVRQTHDEEGIQTCFITIKKLYEESAAQVPNDVANEIKLFERLCELYKPVFHKWKVLTPRTSHSASISYAHVTHLVSSRSCFLLAQVSHTISGALCLVSSPPQVCALLRCVEYGRLRRRAR
jgi:serine/threonine-protein kinase ATR